MLFWLLYDSILHQEIAKLLALLSRMWSISSIKST
jgi:hypothetical protein